MDKNKTAELTDLKGKALVAVSLRSSRLLKAQADKRGTKKIEFGDAEEVSFAPDGAKLILAIGAIPSLRSPDQLRTIIDWAESDKAKKKKPE
ncbi:MAG: hypothetical protein II008_06835, partial [Oscillospiraceae bacterium]|nr:hypothetical protein [Oscillospiraceae bacterium]